MIRSRGILVSAIAACLPVAFFAFGCNKPRKVEPPSPQRAEPAPVPEKEKEKEKAAAPARKPDVRTPGPKAVAGERETAGEPGPDAEAHPEATPAPEEDLLQEKLKNLKFAARRDLMWARAATDNIPSYQEALAKFDREFGEWRMYERVPTRPDVEVLRAEVETLAKKQGIAVRMLEIIEQQVEAREIPEVIHGDKSFDLEDADIRGILLVTVDLETGEEKAVRKFVDGLKQARRLLHVSRVRPGRETTLVNALAFYFKEPRYPLHVVLEKDLAKEMRQAGIDISVEEAVKRDSIGYLQNASLSYREFNASLEKLNDAMRLLSESKFKEARSSFFRRKVEEAAAAAPLP